MAELGYDVVVVGSGAGGGTVAQRLIPMVEAGYRILVLEKGARLRDGEFTGSELEMAPVLYEAGGGFLTADGAMTLAFGSAYGGSTVVYTGTSLEVPERVIRVDPIPMSTAAWRPSSTAVWPTDASPVVSSRFMAMKVSPVRYSNPYPHYAFPMVDPV